MTSTNKLYAKILLPVAAFLLMLSGSAASQESKPNILVVWGDDVGQSNISAYTHGLVGYKTPNIDRIAVRA
jgi:glycosylphosphatidylinositol transamidase (GPIT) subunit GPI8